jgi:hypothetical protein
MCPNNSGACLPASVGCSLTQDAEVLTRWCLRYCGWLQRLSFRQGRLRSCIVPGEQLLPCLRCASRGEGHETTAWPIALWLGRPQLPSADGREL